MKANGILADKRINGYKDYAKAFENVTADGNFLSPKEPVLDLNNFNLGGMEIYLSKDKKSDFVK